MKNDFHRKPITALLKKIIDNRGKTVPTAAEGIPLIATNCIKEDSLYPTFENVRFVSKEIHSKWFRAHLEPGDILFVNKGTPGRVCVVPDPVSFCAAQDMIGLRADPQKIYPRYLFAFLRSGWAKQAITNFHVGLVIPHFKKRDLDAITVPIRSEDEQKGIGDCYFVLSEKIEINRRINEQLRAMAKLLYEFWFVQFDFPITAAQASAMGKPQLEGKPYRTSGGKIIYNEAIKRELPEGWWHSTVGETFKTHLGGTPSRNNEEYWTPGEVNWLSSGENPNTFIVAPDERISKLGLQNSPAKLLPRGTVILSIVRHLRASILGIDAATNQSVVGILETGAIKHCFIYPFLVREIPRLMTRRTGAQQPHINKGVLDETPLVIPDDATLEAYTRLAAPLYLQMENLHQQNKELTKVRDWLLPMLLNGQVTVNSPHREQDGEPSVLREATTKTVLRQAELLCAESASRS